MHSVAPYRSAGTANPSRGTPHASARSVRLPSPGSRHFAFNPPLLNAPFFILQFSFFNPPPRPALGHCLIGHRLGISAWTLGHSRRASHNFAYNRNSLTINP